MLRFAVALALVVLPAAGCVHDPTRETRVVVADSIAPSSDAPVAVVNARGRARDSSSEATRRQGAAADVGEVGTNARGGRTGPAGLSPGWYPVPAPAVELDADKAAADPSRHQPMCVSVRNNERDDRACRAVEALADER